MARPKGSKNKKPELNIEEQIAALEADIEKLQEQVAAKRAEIRTLRAALKEEEQKQLAAMGWHCITVWECELKLSKREQTLDSIAFTLNHIYLQDHSVSKLYEPIEEETGMPMAAENEV